MEHEYYLENCLHSSAGCKSLQVVYTIAMEQAHSITPGFTKRASSPFFRALDGRRPAYSRELGEAWSGDSRRLLRRIPDESIDLIFTSPPYALVRSKEYGNEPEHRYVRWFRPFAKQFHRILKPEGSLVLNIGGTWKPGLPIRSLYQYQLLLDLCAPSHARRDPPIFCLAQEFYWFNPAKLPGPIQWVNVDRVRVKDAVEPIWWLSKTPNPKATNRAVLNPYSEHMKRLIKTQTYNRGPRPSGWVASDKWGRDNGGAIPANFLTEDGLSTLFNVLVESNTSSNDPMRRVLREEGIRAHPAIFPVSLPEFFILMTTDEGDVVLDPFCGSNTTGYVAEQLRRQWLSIDNHREYLQASKARWTPVADCGVKE